MKICLISDTHDLHDDIEMPDADVLVHAGDMTGYGTFNQLTLVNKWFGSLKEKYKKIICIPGNHDWLFEQDFNLAKLILDNATVLLNSGTVYQNISFWGSPYTPRFFDWAFNSNRGEDIAKHWKLIPEHTDILITHGPPRGFGDMVRRRGGCEWTGCDDLLKAIERVKPKLHVFGHIHEGYGEYEYGNIKLVNASICTANYNPRNKPIVVTL